MANPFKYHITLRFKGKETSRYEWAHNPIQAIGLAIANHGASLIPVEFEGIEIVSISLPPEDIEKAEAALMGRIEERLSKLAPTPPSATCNCVGPDSCVICDYRKRAGLL